MAKRIKFPLEMKNGVMVRSLDELKENFDLEKILSYFIDGRLFNWLNDRYYEIEAEQVSQLKIEDKDIKKKICKIFGIDYTKKNELDIEELMLHNERLNKLKQFTNDEDVLKNIDKVAFNQEDLSKLLNEDENIIYVCNGEFIISLTKTNVKYIGISNPIIILESDEDFCLENLNIIIEESTIKYVGRGKNKKMEQTTFKLILSGYWYDLVKINEEEEIIEEHVIDFCKYEDIIFYITNNGEIKKININNIDDKKIIYKLPYYSLGYSRYSLFYRSEELVAERIFTTEDFLIIKISSGVIFKINHNGEEYEKIVTSNYKIIDIFLLEHDLYYLVAGDIGIYKINLYTKENYKLDTARRMEFYNNKIYYLKYLSDSHDFKEGIFSCDLNGKNKIMLKGIHNYGFVRKFYLENNKIIYTTSSEDGKKLNELVIE